MGLPKTFLAVGISLVFVAFVAYGIYVVYEPPKYDYTQNNCYTRYDCNKPISECQEKYLNRSAGTVPQVLPPEYNDCYNNYSVTQKFKDCQIALDACNEEFTKQSPEYAHARNTFFIMLFIGLLAIIGGSMIQHLEGVGSGFIGGGVLLILWSIIQSGIYVYHLDRYIKLAGLGIVLAVLVYIGYKRMDTGAGKKRKNKK